MNKLPNLSLNTDDCRRRSAKLKHEVTSKFDDNQTRSSTGKTDVQQSALVSDHVEMWVTSSPSEMMESGFGMLKSRRRAVPADFGVATFQKK